MSKNFKWFVMLILLFASNEGFAGLKEGLNAYSRSDYAIAIAEWVPLANQGNAKAQFYLGTLYEMGKGVVQDPQKAADWYQKAADQGDTNAQINLGTLYNEGKGVPQDFKLAAEWYRKAADQGVDRAQNNLGTLYNKGKGVRQDFKLAAEWYRKAADQGNTNAQNNLGALYDEGNGVPQDFKLAAQWYRKAADQGNMYGQCNLGLLYDKGRGVPHDYKQAADLYKEAADQGYKRANDLYFKAVKRIEQIRETGQTIDNRPVRIFFDTDGDQWYTGDTVPPDVINTILFLKESCPLPVNNAKNMRRAWRAYNGYQLGCWYQTINGGYVFVGQLPELTHASDTYWESFPLALLHPDSSATIIEKDYDSTKFMGEVIWRKKLEEQEREHERQAP